MISSRNIEDLTKAVRLKAIAFLEKCHSENIDVIITCTYRDAECQDNLYQQGRTKQGPIVTNARAGESWHNYRAAFDVVPIREGKPVWGTSGKDLELWQKIGAIGKSCGLEWAGDWSIKFREFPHFQYTGGLTFADLKAGKKII